MSIYEAARLNMVECQVRTNDVTDTRIQEAMSRVPREEFVPKAKQAYAYMEGNIEVADDRCMMDARCFAKLLQEARIESDDVVLDVACGRGYSTAIIASLAQAVVAIESDEALVDRASELLTNMSVDNAAVVQATLTDGYPKQGPYDVIFINGAVEEVPLALYDQLKDGGRLLAVVSEGADCHARVFNKTIRDGESVIGCREAFDAQIPVLEGFEKPEAFVF